ncbi:hypothetical protein [Candidatus Poriferisodalis sp.]|uniref:hypothetical protein n=1 Tax=Candidatus Poriferisodalis sp. TaxID=3101277 RepID=UPI003AF794FD
MRAPFRAVAERNGDWWEIEITHGLPRNMLGVSQARRRSDVERVARSVIAELLDIAPDGIEIDVDVRQASERGPTAVA